MIDQVLCLKMKPYSPPALHTCTGKLSILTPDILNGCIGIRLLQCLIFVLVVNA